MTYIRDPEKKKAYDKAWRASWTKEKRQARAIKDAVFRARVRAEMIAAYGGACKICGENDPIVLVMDHIQDDGWVDRRIRKRWGNTFYLWLRRNGWPKDKYQILCFNCNYRKEYRRRQRESQTKIPSMDVL